MRGKAWYVIIGTRPSPSLFLHGCETKAGVGRTGNEAIFERSLLLSQPQTKGDLLLSLQFSPRVQILQGIVLKVTNLQHSHFYKLAGQ